MKRKFVMLYSMLGISLLLFAVGAFAWFTVQSASDVDGSQIQAVTEGNLRVYATSTGNGLSAPDGYGDYEESINFSDNTDNIFYDAAIAGAKRTNISGDGVNFFKLVSGTEIEYDAAGTTGIHSYIEFKLYFSAYTGDNADPGEKWVYLTSLSTITDETAGGSEAIDAAIRVAFLDDVGDTLLGVWAPNATAGTGSDVAYVKTGDEYPDATGVFAVEPEETEKLRVVHGGYTGEPSKVAGSALLKVKLGQPFYTVVSPQCMTVRIWIDGTDAVSVDANIRALSNIKLNFAVAPEADFLVDPAP